MSGTCALCRFGRESSPDGRRPPQGTVWCSHRMIQMARQRKMPCFVPLVMQKTRHCLDCKKAKITRPTGETPQPGNIWCEKKHAEINKQRNMECFE